MNKIKIIKGNLLEAKEVIIAHQVNTLGIMGAGLAKSIKEEYPYNYEKYKELCESSTDKDLMGHTLLVGCSDKIIANIFGQKTIGRTGKHTDEGALFNGLKEIKCFMDESKDLTLAIPYKIGSGLGGGDWTLILECINSIFKEEIKEGRVTIYKLK